MQLRRVNLSFTRGDGAGTGRPRQLDSQPFDRRGRVLARHLRANSSGTPRSASGCTWSGMVHDVGKIAVPSEILQKTSALTDDEWALMREHSAEGEKILREVEGYDDIATVVRSHHERWDGAGYPDRIAGEQIPVLARVIAVADSYNAMTTARPYRGPMTPEEAIDQLVRGKGTQFESHDGRCLHRGAGPI